MSDWTVLQGSATFALSAALAAYVGLQRPRSSLHLGVVALLIGFMAWTAGFVSVRVAPGAPMVARLGTLVCFFGVMLVAPIWLFVCARVARVPVASEEPRAFLTALLVPSAVNFAAMLTDPLHGRFVGGETVAVFTEPVLEWAGPFFWLHTLWCYGCVIGGVVLCLASARRVGPGIERRRLLLVAVAASLPLLSIAVLMSGLTTPETHPTPADIGLSAGLLVAAIARYRFLDPSPIAAREILSHLQEGLVLMSPAGAILDANPAAVQILGGSLEELHGRPVDELWAAVDPVEPIALPRDAQGHPILPETSVETRDQRCLDLSGASVLGSDGRAVGQFLVIRDRTQQRRLERRRHRSQRLESLGVLAAGIAHEINNPLAFVRTNLAHLRGIADLVKKHAASFDPPERQPLAEMEEIVQETIAGVDRIAGIVASTRRLSRQGDAERAPIDVNRVCEDALKLAACSDGRRVVFDAAFEPELPCVRGSADQIGQVILNLLVNARQAVRDRDAGRVRLETRSLDGGVEIRVHDNGGGVPAADRERVFDPFFTTKGPDQGTGLGLSIAHEIARSHDGSLEVADSDLGGACFTLRLPR